jgi:hypothetical protein
MARRALLTDRERELIADPEAEDARYVAVSRVRRKIEEELTEDVDVLRRHHPDLFEELRAVVCGEEADPPPSAESSEDSPSLPPVESVSDPVADLDLPGSGETLESRREAVHTLYAHLQEEGTATRSDFLELIDPDEVGYSSAESFWTNLVKARDALKQLPGVEAPSEGEHTWRYSAETWP